MLILSKFIGLLLLALGLGSLATSIIYNSSTLAFIGLGLTLWGPLLLYISTEKYIKKDLMDSTILPSLEVLKQILMELDYKGNCVYLPLKYFGGFGKIKIFLGKKKNTKLPEPNTIQRQGDNIFMTNPEAILINPPGLALSKFFEETQGENFTTTDLEYLKNNLPKLFRDLEISEDVEIQVEPEELDRIQVKLINSVYAKICEENNEFSETISEIGCPICSAIACALAKATGKPLMIERTLTDSDAKTIHVTFRLLEKIEKPTRTTVQPQVLRAPIKLYTLIAPLVKLTSLLMIVLGLILLVFVSILIGIDITFWGKDIGLIFFGSRQYETISLGIGMRVIHYFLLGLGFLTSGLLVFLRERLHIGNR